MYLNIRNFKNNGLRERGSMLVMALFVLIVLALEVYGLRAQLAAQAGLEVLIAQSFPVGTSAQVCNINTSSSSSFSQIAGFRNCRFDAQCASSQIDFEGQTHRYYRFASTGYCEIGEGVVSRTVYVDAMQENTP